MKLLLGLSRISSFLPIGPELHFVVEESSFDEVTVAAQNVNESERKRQSGARAAAGDHLAVNHDCVAYISDACVKRFGLFTRIRRNGLALNDAGLGQNVGSGAHGRHPLAGLVVVTNELMYALVGNHVAAV